MQLVIFFALVHIFGVADYLVRTLGFSVRLVSPKKFPALKIIDSHNYRLVFWRNFFKNHIPIAGILPQPLSEQQIIHCNEAGYGCDGGFWPKAWKDIRNNNYIAQQRQQKYKSKRDETLCRVSLICIFGNKNIILNFGIASPNKEVILGYFKILYISLTLHILHLYTFCTF